MDNSQRKTVFFVMINQDLLPHRLIDLYIKNKAKI